MERILDARGLTCPQPVIRAKEAMKNGAEGQLVILVDNEIAVQNLMRLGSHEGASPAWEKTGEKEYRVLYHLSGSAEPGGMETECEECPVPVLSGRKIVAVLSSDCMGEGDDELGRILMKGFVYALTQLEQPPHTVLLYNGGAKLSCKDSGSLEDLKTLESQGTEVLTCGTCLNYHGLSEELAVGKVTNMYEIAEQLTADVIVVRP